MQVAVQPSDASATKPATLVHAIGARGMPGESGLGKGVRGMREWNAFTRTGVQGTVAAINGTTVTVTTAQGDVVVNTNNNTLFRLPAKANASLADLKVGDKMIVSGHVAQTTPIDADGVAVIK